MSKYNSFKVNYLFVYGTLMRKFNNPIVKEMHKYSIFVDRGFVNALMYEVSSYPGIVEIDKTSKKVYGEVYKLNDLNKVFKLLDTYEECDIGFSKPHEYKRVIANVYIKNKIKKAWIYEYNLSTENLVPIECGDYYKFVGI